MISALVPILLLSALPVLIPLLLAIHHARREIACRHKSQRGCG